MALYTLTQPTDQIFTTPLKLSLINNFAYPSWSGRLPLHGSYRVRKFGYMDGCASWIHGVHAVSSKHRLTIASLQKSIKNTDKGLFTKNNVLLECHGESWCQMLYWLVVTRLCNTRSVVECSHVKIICLVSERPWNILLHQLAYQAAPSTVYAYL